MAPDNRTDPVRVHPNTGRPMGTGTRHRWVRWVFPMAGVVSLLWFLVRVIPKPSRATYPCQRLAAPLASGFVVWLTGIVASSLAYRKAKHLLGQSRYLAAAVLLGISVAAIWMSLAATQTKGRRRRSYPAIPPNTPMGVGKGIHPGRVVWMYEPRAAKWDGKTGAGGMSNTDQTAVDDMVSKSLQTLTGQKDDAAAWDALFRYFNRTHGLGDIGYRQGEKIAIKINMNQDSGGTWAANAGMPSPQMIHSRLDQLMHVVGCAGLGDHDLRRRPRTSAIRSTTRSAGDPDPNFQAVRFVCSSDAQRADRRRPRSGPSDPLRQSRAFRATPGRMCPRASRRPST